MRQRYLLDFSSCIIITRLYICGGRHAIVQACGMRLSDHGAGLDVFGVAADRVSPPPRQTLSNSHMH